MAALRSSSKREPPAKAAELLETRIKTFGDAFFEKAFPNVSAPSAKRGDSVKFVRPYATPTKKLNLRFFGYFLLNYGVHRGLGEKGER